MIAPWMLYLLTGIQLVISLHSLWGGKIGVAVVFFSFALANVGMLIAAAEQ